MEDHGNKKYVTSTEQLVIIELLRLAYQGEIDTYSKCYSFSKLTTNESHPG